MTGVSSSRHNLKTMILPKSVEVLPRAYSHRDCELRLPLWVSLEHGFAHIEIDVYCIFGSVLVGHDLPHLRPQKTLEKLYLEPLQTYVQQHEKTFDETKLYLFVDVKTRAKSSYKLLHTLFCRYRHIVTCSTPETCDAKPSTIVISGNRLPYQSIQEQQERYAVLDGRLEPKLIERSLERVSRLAKHYKGQTDVKRAWSEGDEALLLQAARQSIVQVGSIESLDISQKLCLVGVSNAVGGAASMMMASPLVGLASALEYKGFSVTTLLYDRNHLAETKHSILT